MSIIRSVQVWPAIDPSDETTQPKPKTVRSDVRNNRQQISMSKNRNQQVCSSHEKSSPTNSTGLPLSLRQKSVEVHPDLDEIQQDLHHWCRDLAKSPSSFKVTTLHQFRPKPITIHSDRNQLNLWFSVVDSESTALPPEAVESVSSWAQSRPGLTHGQP